MMRKDKCHWKENHKRCQNESVVILSHLGVELCDEHWVKYCEEVDRIKNSKPKAI